QQKNNKSKSPQFSQIWVTFNFEATGAARRAARTACCGRAESVRPTPVSKPLLQKNSSFKPEKKIDSTFADLYIAPLNF
ncbi:hypothetical protein L6R21_25605, partial [bacterium]|nr:hypothetical protein [bacterium]